MSTTTLPRVSLPYNGDDGADEAREEAMRSAATQAAAPPTPLDARDEAPLDGSGMDAVSAKKSKRKGKKLAVAVVALFVLFLIILVVAVLAVRAMRGGGNKNPTLKVGATEEKRGSETAPNLTDDQKLNAALDLLSRKDGQAGGDAALAGGSNSNLGATNNNASTDPGGGLTNSNANAAASGGQGQQHDGFNNLRPETVPDAGGGQRQAAEWEGRGQAQGAAAPAPTGQANGGGAVNQGGSVNANTGRQAEARGGTLARSVLHSPRKEEIAAAVPVTAGGGSTGGGDARPRADVPGSSIVLPTFGAMLPIKTLGAVYTLRSQGGVVRFQVSYDRRGKGWFVPKGTEIIGVVRGSDYDRAYVTMTGLIDPASGKFIKLSGDILASDGASGLVGKRRQVSGGWSRFFDRLREAGLSSLGALAGGLGRGPVIITDVYRRGSQPVTQELSGVLGDSRNGFVEVGADVSGYAFVTQMPDEVHGVDELAGMARDSITGLADTTRRRDSTGLSEGELAELLTRGDPEALRKALPRMTPQMRRVAEGFLEDAGAR
ncbi:MAG: hypothetical protein ACJ74Q_15770 [Pyrinomonadaceae bacterium]